KWLACARQRHHAFLPARQQIALLTPYHHEIHACITCLTFDLGGRLGPFHTTKIGMDGVDRAAVSLRAMPRHERAQHRLVVLAALIEMASAAPARNATSMTGGTITPPPHQTHSRVDAAIVRNLERCATPTRLDGIQQISDLLYIC